MFVGWSKSLVCTMYTSEVVLSTLSKISFAVRYFQDALMGLLLLFYSLRVQQTCSYPSSRWPRTLRPILSFMSSFNESLDLIALTMNPRLNVDSIRSSPTPNFGTQKSLRRTHTGFTTSSQTLRAWTIGEGHADSVSYFDFRGYFASIQLT